MLVDGLSGFDSLEEVEAIVRLFAIGGPEVTDYEVNTQQ